MERADAKSAYQLLEKLNIAYRKVEHPEAGSMEDLAQAEKQLGAVICKNLFLCNRQKTVFYLLLIPGGKRFKTSVVSKLIGSSRLSFGEPDKLYELLGVHPGSVTVLGLMNDKENKVQLVMDKPIHEAENVACHPCISTSTLCFSRQDLLEKLIPAMGHSPIVVDLPIPEEE